MGDLLAVKCARLRIFDDYVCRVFDDRCQDRFSSTILLGGPGMQGTNEEVSPDTSRC